jgi:hypothetical protein
MTTALERVMMKSMAYPDRGGVALRYPAAALAFVSELIHLWVLPGQLVIAMLPGIFFLLVAMGQRTAGGRPLIRSRSINGGHWHPAKTLRRLSLGLHARGERP